MNEGTTIELKLNEEEKQVIAEIETFAREHCPGISVRVVGGWVRDKLLGRASDDMDIAVEGMFGRDFAQRFAAAAESTPDDDPKRARKQVVIRASADAVKLVEVAKIRILGRWVDVLHLRARPRDHEDAEQRLGSPEDDVLGRDFTINALYYNLLTRRVEDVCGRGLLDLAAHRIATVDIPSATFRQDPVRLFRAARFAATLGFSLDPEMAQAARTDPTLQSLRFCVARERYGVELDKILASPRPMRGLLTLRELGAESVLFHLDPALAASDPWEHRRWLALRVFWALSWPDSGAEDAAFLRQHLPFEWRESGQVDPHPSTGTDESTRAWWVACMFVDEACAISAESTVSLKKSLSPLMDRIQQCSKRSNRDMAGIEVALDAFRQARTLLVRHRNSPEEEVCNDSAALGWFVRTAGKSWWLALACMACLVASSPFHSANESSALPVPDSGAVALRNAIFRWGLQQCDEWKPLVTVAEASHVLGVPPGPKRATLFRSIFEWQFAHALCSDKQILLNDLLDSTKSSSQE